MAQPKIFLTGVTGYIGGDALNTIYEAHPDWDFTALVRNSDKGAQVASRYANVKLIYGNLDDAAVLEDAAKNADVTLHFASADHEDAVKAVINGLKAKALSGNPGYLVHLSGTGILMYPDMDRKTFGEEATKVWDDIESIDEIDQIPDHAPHRNVDKLVRSAGLNAAIVCPPMIYGKGSGPGNQRSIQTPALARSFLQRGKGFYVGAGKTHWTMIHVHDLSNLFLRLAEEAALHGGHASWGREGYYYAENGDFLWREVSEALAGRAKKMGMLESDGCDSLPPDEISKMAAGEAGPLMWGANSRATASRARKELGWRPEQPSVFSAGVLDEILKIEKDLIDRGVDVQFHT